MSVLKKRENMDTDGVLLEKGKWDETNLKEHDDDWKNTTKHVGTGVFDEQNDGESQIESNDDNTYEVNGHQKNCGQHNIVRICYSTDI